MDLRSILKNGIAYLRRHIYGELKSGDRNNARTMKWGFFSKNPRISFPVNMSPKVVLDRLLQNH